MEVAKTSAEALRNQIAATEKQLQELRNQLAGLESPDKADTQPSQPCEHGQPRDSRAGEVPKWPLTQEEYNRYGRQMIVSSIGIKGQLCKCQQLDHGTNPRQANYVYEPPLCSLWVQAD